VKHIAILGTSLSLLLTGCARHVVVEREGGRIDAAKSTSSYSDTQWTIERAPAAASTPAANPETSPGVNPEASAVTPR
jgi:hypothetical protein